MPKKDPKAGKKARWTAAEKADAQKKTKRPHRGQADAPRDKKPRAERAPRWDDDRRAGRDSAAERSPRGPRTRPGGPGPRRVDDAVGHRKHIADDRGRRSWDDDRRDDQRDDRRDDRGERTYAPRPFRSDDRGERRGDGRGVRRFEGQGRRFDGDRGEQRRYDDRPRRFEDRGDRGEQRRFDDRPRRFEDRGDRDRGERRYDDRPRRFEDRGDRGERRYDDRPRRFEDRGDRGERGEQRRFDDRPRRFEDRGDRDRGERRSDDRPRRWEDRGERRFEDRGPRRDFAAEQDRRFEEVRADQEAADTWTKYESRKATGPAEVTEDNGFAALGLPERLVERLARDGITEPFEIQSATIPDALAGRDVLGRGRTGSGKTLAFGLPTITRLAASGKAKPRRPRALVLVPTRELAMQVSDALEPLVHVMGLRHKLVAGGLSYEPQISALARGVDLLIATPGRLSDLLERGALELSDIEVVILDEADHMAEMGFMTEIDGVLEQLPPGQRLLFSATLDRGVDRLVEQYLQDPVTHSTDEAQAAVTTMAHHLFLVEPNHKKVVTAELAARPGRTVVFVRTKLGADRVASQLREVGVMAAALHGGLTQGARNRVLGAFRTGDLPVLVATDVAARGIHVDDVSLVLQVDPPADHKDYLHRAGRTARAGEEGAVVTLALPHQKRSMERLLGEAGVDTTGIRALPGSDPVRAAGGREPGGEPVDPDRFRAMLEPARPKRGQSRPSGPRPERGRPYRRAGGEADGQRRFGRPRHKH